MAPGNFDTEQDHSPVDGRTKGDVRPLGEWFPPRARTSRGASRGSRLTATDSPIASGNPGQAPVLNPFYVLWLEPVCGG